MKEFTFRIIAGANIATIVVMLLIGFSDRINPPAHPLIALAAVAWSAAV